MWLLVIILLSQVPGLDKITVLKTFPTYQACKEERNRIGFDMAESYPETANFTIDCIKDVTAIEKLKT